MPGRVNCDQLHAADDRQRFLVSTEPFKGGMCLGRDILLCLAPLSSPPIGHPAQLRPVRPGVGANLAAFAAAHAQGRTRDEQ